MSERDPDFFKFHYRQWKRRMIKLRVPYDMQGALLAVVIETHLVGSPPADDDFILAGVFGVSPRKARAISEGLKARGLAREEDGFLVNDTAVEDVKTRDELRAIRSRAGREGGVRSGVVRCDKAKLNDKTDGTTEDKPLKENKTDEANASPGFELEKRREEKRRNTPHTPQGGRGLDSKEFEEWYAHYPRKEAKGRARTAFKAARKKADLETLIAATKRYAAATAGKEREHKAHPATWLNGERWLDETESTPQNPVATLEARVSRARDWLSRHDTIQTWMDNKETAQALLQEGFDYDRLRLAGFSLPPRGNVVDISGITKALGDARRVGGD